MSQLSTQPDLNTEIKQDIGKPNSLIRYGDFVDFVTTSNKNLNLELQEKFPLIYEYWPVLHKFFKKCQSSFDDRNCCTARCCGHFYVYVEVPESVSKYEYPSISNYSERKTKIFGTSTRKSDLTPTEYEIMILNYFGIQWDIQYSREPVSILNGYLYGYEIPSLTGRGGFPERGIIKGREFPYF